MDKDMILKLIKYAEFSGASNYIECSFYEYFDNEDDIELTKRIENLKTYCNK